jgi:hypothetical protein
VSDLIKGNWDVVSPLVRERLKERVLISLQEPDIEWCTDQFGPDATQETDGEEYLFDPNGLWSWGVDCEQNKRFVYFLHAEHAMLYKLMFS